MAWLWIVFALFLLGLLAMNVYLFMSRPIVAVQEPYGTLSVDAAFRAELPLGEQLQSHYNGLEIRAGTLLLLTGQSNTKENGVYQVGADGYARWVPMVPLTLVHATMGSQVFLVRQDTEGHVVAEPLAQTLLNPPEMTDAVLEVRGGKMRWRADYALQQNFDTVRADTLETQDGRPVKMPNGFRTEGIQVRPDAPYVGSGNFLAWGELNVNGEKVNGTFTLEDGEVTGNGLIVQVT